jgi:uncharacterized protein (DUF1810 family)
MSTGSTPASFDPARFVDAQASVYDAVLAELRTARKRSHWMWFVFPQLKGLGHSATAQFYGLASRAEAQAYWRHPLLGPRLRECAALLLQAPPGQSALQILGSPDDLKLRSCMTLFAEVAPQEPVFKAVLQRYFDGQPDPRTLDLLDAR